MTKRITMANMIKHAAKFRAINLGLLKQEVKTQCNVCGHTQKVIMDNGETKTIICKHCETMYNLKLMVEV